jgi:hypothetical protein
MNVFKMFLAALAVGGLIGQAAAESDGKTVVKQTTVTTERTVSVSRTKTTSEPKIAVANLAYEERVREYFHTISAKSKSSVSARSSERETDRSYSARDRVKASSESSYQEEEGTYSYIERGELRHFTADIKGNMLKGGGVRLVEAKPYSGKDSEKIFDVIARIKQGMFPGADYVLFGTVSNIEFRNQYVPIQGTSTYNHIFSLDMVVDFSLINTKTYEIKAAFSAMGEAQDLKMVTSRGDIVTPNRSRVIMEASKDLGEQAYGQLLEQFGLSNPNIGYRNHSHSGQGGESDNPPPPPSNKGPVMNYNN